MDVSTKMAVSNNGNGTPTTLQQEALLKIGEQILLHRRRLGLGQQELADLCNDKKLTNLTQQRISDIEFGRVSIMALELLTISRVFGIDMNYFNV